MATWYGAADAAQQARLVAAWADAPVENEELCGMLLEVSQLQVVDYAPSSGTLAAAVGEVLLRFGQFDRLEEVLALLGTVEEAPGVNLVYAQLQQAKNLAMAGAVSASGDFGEGQFTFTPRPLDKTIRNIIRPVGGMIDAL